eukprot:scaffold3589_cov279-Chaetoceros_neogracile.AAC.4
MSARQIGEVGHLMGETAKLEHFHFAFRGVGRRARNRILVSTIFLSMFVLWRKEEGTRRILFKKLMIAVQGAIFASSDGMLTPIMIDKIVSIKV